MSWWKSYDLSLLANMSWDKSLSNVLTDNIYRLAKADKTNGSSVAMLWVD
jgi:hypothetical protein